MNNKPSVLQFVATACASALLAPACLGQGGHTANVPRIILVQEGRPAAAIVVPDEPLPGEQRAASELQTYVKKMSGAELPIVKPGLGTNGIQVVLGRACGALQDEPTTEDAFVIRTQGERLLIKGANELGTLYGVCALLEDLGVRWYTPDELGEIVPKQATVALAPRARMEAPGFAIRYIGKRGLWPARVRSNVSLDGLASLDYKSAHTFGPYLPFNQHFDPGVCR